MDLRFRFYFALSISVLTIGLHMIFHGFYLYWTFPHIDIPMHLLGGLMAGFYVLVFLRYFKYKETLLFTLIGTLIIGVAWELLEMFYRVADITFYYWIDTIGDLINDSVGGLTALYIWKKIPEKK